MNKRLLIGLLMLLSITSIGTFSFMMRAQKPTYAEQQQSPDDQLLRETFMLLKTAREDLHSAINSLRTFAARAGRRQALKLHDVIKALSVTEERLRQYSPAQSQ
jgi:hypothetical protein